MAKKKKQFCPHIYPEWGELFDAVSIEERGELLLAITKFPEYEPNNIPIWNFIKSQLQKDYEIFVEKCEKNGEISKSYWERKKSNVSERIPNETERHPKLKRITKTETKTLIEDETKKGDATTPPDNFVSDLSDWYGEYSNVHLNQRQYDLLLQEILDKGKLSEIIEELSENIACNNSKAPPYDDKNPEMHFALLRKYWRFRKNNGGTRPQNIDKAAEFKKKMDELANKYRLEEAMSG